MQSALIQALRACGRTTITAKPLASTTSRVALTRRTFLIAPSYKARIAARGYATATATKKKATPTTKKPTAKKPAVKKAAAKPAAKKAVAKTAKGKAKAKPKKAAVKKPVKRVKKEIDPEKKAVLVRRELKRKALINAEPKQLPTTTWVLFLQDHLKGAQGGDFNFATKIKEVHAQWVNVSPAEKERLQERCNENKITNAANYKKWVETHPVLEIATANQARARLIREFKVKINPIRITDERMPKRPLTSFGQFLKVKSAGKTGAAPEWMKTLSSQWKTLSDADKKPYQDLEAAERVRFEKEMQRINA